MRQVYLDHSATTPVDREVVAVMLPYFTEIYGNANSLHAYGQKAAYAVDAARRRIAELLAVKPSELYFTSGGTEADNWALKGVAAAYGKQKNHIITSAIEHPAILAAAKQLQKEGYRLTFLPVNNKGIVEPASLKAALGPDTCLVSVMLANNEIGTLQPIKELAAIAHEAGALFHTDAVQAMGCMPVRVKELGADLMSFSAHKFYGPKGIGCLYIKGGVKPDKLVIGGHQERTMRGGTTNVPGVVGMAKALEIAFRDMDENYRRVKALRDRFVREIKERVPDVIYNGDEKNRLPQNANFTFEYIEGESLLLRLDLKGICCSSGSACSSGSLEPSHVLLATGLPIEKAHGSIRFSFGKDNCDDDVDYAVENIVAEVERLREMSPLFKEIKGECKHV